MHTGVLHMAYAKVATHRTGKRVYLQTRRLEDAGFAAGVNFMAIFEEDRIELVATSTGDRRVCGRTLPSGKRIPVIDISGRTVNAIFGGAERVRVLYRDGRVEIDLHPVERAAQVREKRIREQAVFETGSLCTGIGVLDAALHEGLSEAGHRTKAKFAVEINETYLDAGLERNDTLAGTMSVLGSLDEIEPEFLGQVDILAAGLPCTAASVSGRAKKKLILPEADPDAGHLVVPFLDVVKRTNPGIVILENVPAYSSTASMSIIRTVLDKLGYRLFEMILDGEQFSLERRRRLCMVAFSKGIAPDHLDVVPLRSHHQLSEILEEIPETSQRWKTADYLNAKEVRDRAAGKGFAQQVVTTDVPSVGTIGRGYAKWRTTEPRLAHSTDPALSRLFTPREHARIKGIPEHLIDDMPGTTAHELMGQSVIYAAFVAVGKAIGKILNSLAPAAPVIDCRGQGLLFA